MKRQLLSAVLLGLVLIALVQTLRVQSDYQNTQQQVAAAIDISLISQGVAGAPADEQSAVPVVSATGRFVVFESLATNLVAGDTNQARDVFLWDSQLDEMSRISSSVGGDANGPSFAPAISTDENVLVFHSYASDLVPNDGNSASDIFLHDRKSGGLAIASVANDGSAANGGSLEPDLSADGRFVVFSSLANNLVLSDTNLHLDIFVRDTLSNTTEMITWSSQGMASNGSSYAPVISANGRFVTYYSDATNLVNDDTNNFTDIFLHDRQTGITERVTMGPGGTEANGNSYLPTMTADGQLITFMSDATNLITDTNTFFDIFLWERTTGNIELVSLSGSGTPGNGHSFSPDINADGSTLVYFSDASNLAAADTNTFSDIFLLDMKTGAVRLISDPAAGTANGPSLMGTVSDDGLNTAFISAADNLVSGDSNGVNDVFLATINSSPVLLNTFLPAIWSRYPPSYQIAGQVQLPGGSPLAAVSMQTSIGVMVTTAADGRYAFTLPAGTYELRPIKSGYTFSPVARTITVPPDAASVDFVANPVPVATSTPSPTPTHTPSPSPTPTSTPIPCDEQIVNGGFETNDGWTIGNTLVPGAYDTAVAYSGNRSMRYGILNQADNVNTFSSAWQFVTIPANVTSATLHLWLFPVSGEALWMAPAAAAYPSSAELLLANDAQLVLLFDEANQQHVLLMQKRNDQNWLEYAFDVSAFAGQTVQIYLGVVNDGFDGVTAMYTDAVSLQTCEP